MEQSFIEELYAVHKEKPFFKSLVAYMLTGPVLIFKIEANDSNLISNVRYIVEKIIRPKYAIDATANSIHASDSFETAQYEYDIIKKYLKIK